MSIFVVLEDIDMYFSIVCQFRRDSSTADNILLLNPLTSFHLVILPETLHLGIHSNFPQLLFKMKMLEVLWWSSG